jgi:hypothetical protein
VLLADEGLEGDFARVEAEREGSVLSALSVRVRGVEVEVEFSSQPG